MSSTAYVFVFTNIKTGKVENIGILSDEEPTMLDGLYPNKIFKITLEGSFSEARDLAMKNLQQISDIVSNGRVF